MRAQLEELAERSMLGTDGRLPGLLDHLESQLDFLDDPPSSLTCDHTLTQTVAFLCVHGADLLWDLAWLMARGGYCDCEVLFNVSE